MLLVTTTRTDAKAIRFALAEKKVPFTHVSVAANTIPAAYKHLVFTPHEYYLIDRQLIISGPRIILEYIDERYPAPALMPLDPIARAQARLLMREVDALLRRVCQDYSRNPDTRHMHALIAELEPANEAVNQQEFILGPAISLVDLVLFECLDAISDESPRSMYSLPHLNAYLNRLRLRTAAHQFRLRDTGTQCASSSSPSQFVSSTAT